jgi:sugar lactone lactonase YvrE
MIFNSMLNILGFCSSILGSSGKYWNVTGITYFGSGTAGSSLNQLNGPTGIFLDSSGTLYISDSGNYRVLSYQYNATNATIIAGTSGVTGTALNQFSANMRYIYVDTSGNIYIADKSNDRVMRWAIGGSIGVMVAGNGTAGPALSELYDPYGVWVDSNSNIFVTEYSNYRATKWAPNATAGVLVAGITGSQGN